MSLENQPTIRMPEIPMDTMVNEPIENPIEDEIMDIPAAPVIEENFLSEDMPEICPEEEPISEEYETADYIPETYLPTPQIYEEELPKIKEEPIDLEEEREDIKPVKPMKSVKMNHLTEEQKAIFSYFVPVKGMEEQLCKALSGIVSNYRGEAKSSRANLIVSGSQGCGKTVLATSIVKVLQKECGHPNGKIGKINAEALNKKDVQQLLRKVSGGCLIIENAGALNKNTTVSLSLLLEQDQSNLLVILEDSAAGIRKVMGLEESFAKMFTETVAVPIFSNDDLVVFAKSYANERGYVIDEMAILALHNCISNIEKYDQATTLEEVKEIIDDAIYCEAHGGLRKAFNILTAKRYTDDDQIVLTEKDFE